MNRIQINVIKELHLWQRKSNLTCLLRFFEDVICTMVIGELINAITQQKILWKLNAHIEGNMLMYKIGCLAVYKIGCRAGNGE